jgi:hypothetical protein
MFVRSDTMRSTIKNITARIILPSTLAAVVFIAFFFIDERSTPIRDFEDERYSISDYMVFIMVLAGVGSIFKFISDRLLGDKIQSRVQFLISILVIASLFLAVFLTLAMINGEFPSDIFIEVTLLVLALATLIQVLSFCVEQVAFRIKAGQ